MHLDRDVRQTLDTFEPFLVELGRLGIVRDDGRDDACVPWPQPPHVKIRDSVRAELQLLSYGRRKSRACDCVEEHGARRSQEPERPMCNDQRCDDSHGRIHPGPALYAPCEQSHDGQHRCHRIGKHVQVGSANIAIVSMIVLFMVMPGRVRMSAAQ